MSGSKSKFAENMDYKALSPDFHALALSKISFVWINYKKVLWFCYSLIISYVSNTN